MAEAIEVLLVRRIEAGGMELHLRVVQLRNKGAGPTVKVAPGPDRDRKGGTIQVQTTRDNTGVHPGNSGGGGQRSPGRIRDLASDEGPKRV